MAIKPTEPFTDSISVAALQIPVGFHLPQLRFSKSVSGANSITAHHRFDECIGSLACDAQFRSALMVGLTGRAPFGSDFECTTACTGEIRVLPHISATLVEQYANDSSGKMQQLQQSTVISTHRKDPPVATGAQGVGTYSRPDRQKFRFLATTNPRR
jgi:hypothetical protein